MGEIRGEKVNFRKQDIVPLHRYPSAQTEDPVIVHCPRQKSVAGRCFSACVGMLLLLVVAVAGVVLLVENGLFDSTLNARAQSALDNAIGPRFRAEVGSTVVRFTSGLQLALEAQDVNMIEAATGEHISRTGAIRLALDPLALVRGRIAINNIEADEISLEAGLLGSGAPIDLSGLRVDQIPVALEAGFAQMDVLKRVAERSQTDVIRISGLTVNLPVSGKPPLAIDVDDLTFTREPGGSLRLAGNVTIEGQLSRLDVTAESAGDRTSALTASLSDVGLASFLFNRADDGTVRQGIDSIADVTISARRSGEAVTPMITIGTEFDLGSIYIAGNQQELYSSAIQASYDFSKNSLEIDQSQLTFGETKVPFTGAVIDLDRIDPAGGRGYGVDLVVKDGLAAPDGSGEAPLAFDAKAFGRYVANDKELTFDELAVSSPLGAMVGTMRLRFGDASPEISFSSQTENLQAAAIKQLWPFWMASKARRWVLANLFGGTVTNGSIGVFIPAGRLGHYPIPLQLNENELQISFDIDDARINTTGEIPPIRDMNARFELKGERVAVDVRSGSAYFSTDRSVKVESGQFVIPSTYEKPLMAELKLALSGSADAVAELATYKPIAALQRTGFEPQEFSGKVRADLVARFGLVKDQDPPPPVWQASLKLANVDLSKEMDGRRISSLDGTLDVDPQRAILDGKGRIDGVPLNIRLVEPVGTNTEVKRERLISGTLDGDDQNRLVPGLKGIVTGPIKIELSMLDDKKQSVEVDLSRASVSVPWVGWTKGSGVAARASFVVAGNDNGNTDISGFSVTGEGFGANGDMTLNKSGLVAANFSSVKLSSDDDFSVLLKRGKSGYDVSILGSSADVRPIIGRIRAQASSAGASDDTRTGATVRASLRRVIGFNGETLSNTDLVYAATGSTIRTLEFSGTTGSGQAVVSQMSKARGSRNFIHVTSGDAGALSRFLNLYKHMKGGLLNVKLRADDDQVWNGNLDIRNFKLVNEERLQSIVSTPVGRDGRSLNTAVKRDIDVSSANFQRAFARLVVRNGILQIENGVLRGDQVGATFQGTLRDASGQMDMTGTFMPAYGLNRLFAELPIIGVILGNGRDRGLLGITFRLSGSFEQPRLIINPLSIIAPGVFRQIFEFQ
ncbi:DUF3971 domain-containing protein [Rhizobiaceae bacterium n13]|uniref:DUF3971 domain-containing protein n=1 Tax=Ferirhizobium litorale TaxID=2927786 RepID=A0AAE3U2R7_9HYPH|nr:DUF3971 domain-containing protein [Fererhizobium litorale]MDI7863289.1 DUF3971 domain-containing protein [Fererhizobium litorale]MDI7922977.1 DUF3971 domain-containing protein [Fererhizobium litorale]